MALASMQEAIGHTMVKAGFPDVRAGSQAHREQSEQVSYAGRSSLPVEDAYSIALMRLTSALDHFAALSLLLGADPARPYASASFARAALVNSVKAWWLLDPELDVRDRIGRGRADSIENLWELKKIPIPELRQKALATLDQILADTEAIGFEMQESKDPPRIVGFGPWSSTDLLTKQLGVIGEIAFRELSSAAHGMVSGLAGRLEPAGLSAKKGITVVKPLEDWSGVVSYVAIALMSFEQATDRRFALYGYDTGAHWEPWKASTHRLMLPLLRSADPSG